MSLLRPLALATLVFAGLLSACSRTDPLGDVGGISLAQAEMGREFTLTDAEGKTRSLEDFKGKALVVFFGFVQCPDVCPTSLLRASKVQELLGDDAERVQVAFITVDPERDTPEILKAYTSAFDPGFIALTGTPEQIARTAKEYKVFYQKVPTGSSYTIDHTALSYVHDTEGKLQLALRHEQTPQEVAADLRKVLSLH
ncbi:SCO family protein [Mesopusillimonas faecipullorum]